jgi:hypothetical protein
MFTINSEISVISVVAVNSNNFARFSNNFARFSNSYAGFSNNFSV